MDPRFRILYLLLGAAGLAFLIYVIITTFDNINPVDILIITIPDMLFFFLAYKTYPAEEAEAKNFVHSRKRSY